MNILPAWREGHLMRYARLPCLIIAALVVVGCRGDSSSEQAEAAALAAIEEARERYIEAAKSGNVDEMMAVYSDEVVWMPPAGERVNGKEGLRKVVSAMFAEGGFPNFSYEPQRLEVHDGVAIELNLYHLTGPEDRGSDIHIWRRQPDGSWKIHLDIFTRHKPAP